MDMQVGRIPGRSDGMSVGWHVGRMACRVIVATARPDDASGLQVPSGSSPLDYVEVWRPHLVTLGVIVESGSHLLPAQNIVAFPENIFASGWSIVLKKCKVRQRK